MQIVQFQQTNTDMIARGLWTLGAGQKPRFRRETVIRASKPQPDPGNALAFPVLWYRYQLATWYLELEGWADRDIWTVSLGIGDDNSLGSKFASMAQAVVDLSLVDATIQSRGATQLHRSHQSFTVGSIGIIDRLSWESGERTDKGRDIDANIAGMFDTARKAAS